MKHPYQIEVRHNEQMDCEELILSMGNFPNEAEAKRIAAELIRFLEATVQ